MRNKKVLAGFLALLAGAVLTQQVIAEGPPPLDGGPGETRAAGTAILEVEDNHLQGILEVPEGGVGSGPEAAETERNIDGLGGPGDEAPDAAGDEWEKLQAANCLNRRESTPADIGTDPGLSYFKVTLNPKKGTFPGMQKWEEKILEVTEGHSVPLSENIPYYDLEIYTGIEGLKFRRDFQGWGEKPTDRVPTISLENPYIPKADITLWAIWESDDGEYMVTLQPDERDHSREAVEFYDVPGNSVIWSLPDWRLAGHAPVGWEIEMGEQKTRWEQGKTKITADMTVRPLYDVEDVTVTFRAGNGTTDVPQIIVKGECAQPPIPDPVWEGRRFLYWEGPDGPFDFTIPPETDLTLTGVWEEISQAAGGPVSKENSVRYDKPIASSGSGGGEKTLLNPSARSSAATFRLADDGRVGASRMAELIRRNQTADVVLQGDNVTFRFRKGTMRQGAGREIYDFRASFAVEDRARIEEAAGPALALAVHYNYSGELPAEAEITIKVGREYAGQTLYYYYFNPETGALEFVQSAMVDSEGYVTVRQSHCSDYAFLTVNLYGDAAAEAEAAPRDSGSGQGRRLPDAGEPAPWRLAVLGGALLAISLMSFKKALK